MTAECHKQYKTYGSLYFILMNVTEIALKIKSVILIKDTTNRTPHLIEFNNSTITDPTGVGNVTILLP